MFCLYSFLGWLWCACMCMHVCVHRCVCMCVQKPLSVTNSLQLFWLSCFSIRHVPDTITLSKRKIRYSVVSQFVSAGLGTWLRCTWTWVTIMSILSLTRWFVSHAHQRLWKTLELGSPCLGTTSHTCILKSTCVWVCLRTGFKLTSFKVVKGGLGDSENAPLWLFLKLSHSRHTLDWLTLDSTWVKSLWTFPSLVISLLQH